MSGSEGRTWRQRHALTRLKAHIGVDADSGLVHTVVGTAANVGDVTRLGNRLYGQESEAFGDASYQGVDKREANQDQRWRGG